MKNKILNKIPLALLIPMALSSCGASGYDVEKVDVSGGSAFYEIFVGSYCDSNGDGIGDLKGIESKLDYLADLGVSTIWLTPVHPSNSYHKYDVKDYYAIDPTFGSVEDFESLAKTAKSKGINIIMDMVFNHTSITSSWFNSFCQAISSGDSSSPYYGDFSWSRTPKDGYTQIAKAAGLYIETNFDGSMPELNLDSTHVREELAKIQNYWLDKGASGFRYDAVMYYYCSNSGGTITGDTEKNVAVMKYLADSARAKKSDVYLIGEAWVNDDNTLFSYAKSTMNVFYFPGSGVDTSGSAGKIVLNGGPQDFASAVEDAQKGFKASYANSDLAYFVSNHDQDRWGGFRNGHAMAEEARRCIASAYLLTPGTPFMYYGEEIQMLGTRPSGAMTDAARRQAMVWGDPTITCKQPENYTVKEQVSVGVNDALKDGYSTINHYRKVLSIRNKYKELFRHGTFTSICDDDTRAVAFKITHNGETFYLFHNCDKTAVEITLPASGLTILEQVKTVKESSSINDKTLSIPAYSSVLVR